MKDSIATSRTLEVPRSDLKASKQFYFGNKLLPKFVALDKFLKML